MKYLSLSVLCFIIGCSTEKQRELTFIGGRIVNPNSNHIILEHNDQLIDTIFLDANNNFKYEFLQEKESVFTFRHYPEIQTIYLKPGDSTLLRVNTLEFDESLSFVGSSSKENNFLINTFLLNEQDNDLILSYYKIKPEEFINKTDSVVKKRYEDLEKLKSEQRFSSFFENIAKSSIEYEHYDMKERYAFLIKKYLPKKFDEFPADFFEYRKQVNFNHPDLVSNFSYMRFLDNYLRNKSIELCEVENRDCFDLNNHENLKRRLNLVHELFDHEYIKHNFFNRFIRREIIASQTQEQLDETWSIVKKFNLSEEDQEQLNLLSSIQSNYLIGSSLKNLKLRTSSFDTIRLEQAIKPKPTLIYTWSALSFEAKKLNLKKIDELKEKYPEFNFISINLDFQNPVLWTTSLSRFHHDYFTEFQLVSEMPINTHGFFRNYLNKAYLLDENLILTNNSLSLFNPKIESTLLEFLNQ